MPTTIKTKHDRLKQLIREDLKKEELKKQDENSLRKLLKESLVSIQNELEENTEEKEIAE